MRPRVVLWLGGAAAGAYGWFQRELPLPKWASITAVGSTIGAKVSALGDKVAGLVAGLRRRAPVAARPAAKPVAPSRNPGATAVTRPAAPSQLPPPPPPPPPPPLPPSPPARTKLDLAGDSLTQVVRTFADRARLFDQKQLACAGLAPGLELVEKRWIAYNAPRDRNSTRLN